MVIAGILCLAMGLVYYFFTQDTPEGNFQELKEKGEVPLLKKDEASFSSVLKDYRVWILFFVYAACFGIELTVYGTMDDYLQNRFGLDRTFAGNLVLSFALMNIFARTLGGYFGDKFGNTKGVRGRVLFLAVMLGAEGLMLSFFSMTTSIAVGMVFLIAFSLTVQMAEGATFSVVPFINKKAIGSISGIVGAGGNVGAFLAALLLKSKSAVAESSALVKSNGLGEEAMKAAQTAASASAVSAGYFLIGGCILLAALLSLAIKFTGSKQVVTSNKLNVLLADK